ncbi:hypothetical protein C7S18_20965 [Ahniella affigens]|uniref:Uncharacterized protein n=1 Tax=Ahniella affigens TaxID=2021234 RepID=A0A2P1PXB1_9GAMM|nr:hypothetical protein C7S18_20965 [Ahniella affigens]
MLDSSSQSPSPPPSPPSPSPPPSQSPPPSPSLLLSLSGQSLPASATIESAVPSKSAGAAPSACGSPTASAG